MKASVWLRDWGGRIARGAFAAAVIAAASAWLDAAWAASAADGAAGPGALSLTLVDIGLIAPLGLLLGVASAALAIVLAPTRAPTPASLVAELRILAFGRPAEVAAFVPLVVFATFFWMTVSAHFARAVLGVEIDPKLAGMAIGAGTLALGALFALAALTFTPPLRRALATASERRRGCVDPAVTGGVALAIVALLFAFGVATGSLAGEGGLLGVYGVFRRPELDLRGASIALAIAFAGFFAPTAARRLPGLFAFALSLSPLALTLRAGGALDDSPQLAASIERGAPVGRVGLAVIRALTDRDHDGASPHFGGGDCDDRNPGVHPLAEEIVDNGIDDDCSGADLTSADLAKLNAPAPAKAPEAQGAARIPGDLNLVLITIDTLRADLGFMGYPRAVSPNLDALAARSTVFERAYSLASYTGKSVGPMLIGKYGSETDRNWGHFNVFGDKDTFVAERLKRAGIWTMSVQGHRYFGNFGGLDRGIDVLDMSAAPPEGAPWDVDNEATSSKITDAALALLDKPESTSKRFFLWVHYLDPHADYLKHDDVPSFGKAQRDLYDGEVAFTDKHIGRVLDAIAKAPWGEKTAVIVTSDHGEAFGEHNMYRHGFELWEPLVRVPLVVHIPGIAPSRVSARRSAIDLAPTILEAMQVDAPPASTDPEVHDFLSGVSLVPDMRLGAGEAAEVRDVLIDMPAGPYNDARRSLIHGDQKLTVANGVRFELYDLESDPDEKKNLYSTPEGKEAKAYYDAFKQRLREIRVTGKRK